MGSRERHWGRRKGTLGRSHQCHCGECPCSGAGVLCAQELLCPSTPRKAFLGLSDPREAPERVSCTLNNILHVHAAEKRLKAWSVSHLSEKSSLFVPEDLGCGVRARGAGLDS